MRILSITYEFPPVGGGTGKSALQMGRALGELGHDVTFLTSRFKGLAERETVDGLRVLRIPVLRRHINYAAAWEVLSFVFSGMSRLDWIRRETAPELILAYFTIPGAPIAWAFRRRFGTPFVTLLRGQDVPGYPDTPSLLSALSRPAVRFLWRRSLMVTANSEGLANLARQTLPGMEFPVIANAVDPERYRPAATPPPTKPLRILFVGRLREFKGIHHLIDALARLHSRSGASCELRIAGYGPWQGRLESQIERLGLGGTVRLLGRLDEAGVTAEMQSAHVFVNPSFGEGMPNAVLEAMACGLPVVLSDIEPHREMIEDGVEGVIVPLRDPEALAVALEGLLNDPERRARLGEAARRRVMQQFTWADKARDLIERIHNRMKP